MKSCFLFGHEDCPQTMLPKIVEAIERHYLEFGVKAFYVGNRESFDGLAAAAVKRVKQRHKDISLYLLLAYHPAERAVYLSDGFDGSYYPPLEHVPRQYTIARANQYMVDHADSMICYVWHIGNARNLLAYARRQRKDGVFVENLAENF